MDNKSKEVIKEVISDIIKYRKDELDELFDSSFKVKNKPKRSGNPLYHNYLTLTNYYKTIVKLNNLLEIEDRNVELLKITNSMAKIQAKKYITIKEFTEIYNVSTTSQQSKRGRLDDPLPYHQAVKNGKITYHVEEVEKWLENQYK